MWPGLPTLQHSRQAPGQGRRTAQLMCAWCLGHVRSDGLLRVGEAIMDARPGAGKGLTQCLCQVCFNTLEP